MEHSMKSRFVYIFGSLSLLTALLIFSGSATAQGTSHQNNIRSLRQQATAPSELPADTKSLELDKPVADSLDPQTPGRFYKFQAKADQLLNISITPKSNSLYAVITVLVLDLQSVLGGTQGEYIIGGSVTVRIPEDGTYVVSVDYADSMIGTPTPGNFEIALSEFKLK